MKIKLDDVNKFLDFLNYDSYYFQTFKPRINGAYQNGVLSQEFCNRKRVISLCEKLNGKGVICVALNYRPKGGSKAKDVNRLKVVAIDIDVKDERKVNYVSTEEDYKHAQETALRIKDYLEKEYGLVINLVVKSGNGAQVLAKCDIPINDLDLLKSKLTKLEDKVKDIFNDKIIDIDAITKDVNRRLKIPGTINKKDTHQKSNRFSEIIYHKKVTSEDIEQNSKVIDGFEIKNEDQKVLSINVEAQKEITNESDLIEITKRDEKLHDLLTLSTNKLNKKYLGDDGIPKYKSDSEVDMAVITKLLFYGVNDKLIDWFLTKRGGSWSKKSQNYRDRSIEKGKEFQKKSIVSSTTIPRTYTNIKYNIINIIYNNMCVYVGKKLLNSYETVLKLNSDNGFSFDEKIFQGVFFSEKFQRIYFVNEKISPSKIRELISELLNKNGKLCFFITPQKVIEGRNIGSISQHKELISVVKQIRCEKNDEITEEVLLLHDAYPRGAKMVKTVELPFFVYDFISDDQVKYVLLSLDELPIGSIRLRANRYSLSDKVDVTKNLKISTNQKILIVFDAEPLVNNWTPDHFNEFMKVGYDKLLTHIFNVYREPKGYEWVEDLTMASLICSPYNGYPIHLCKLGFEGCFKSKWLNLMHKSLGEPQPITSGEASRLKGIIPSYKSSPPDPGAFLKAKCFCGVDEFFKIIQRETSMGDVSRAISGLNALNSLLEWQVRLFGSGTGAILKSKPTSRFFCTSNFVDLQSSISESSGYCLDDCFKDEFMSFVSRLLFFCVTRDHKEAIIENIKTEDDEVRSKIKSSDWLNCYEFMVRSPIIFSSDVKKKVMGIHSLIKSSVFSGGSYLFLKRYFSNMRMINAFFRLLDGLVKVRCLKTGKWDLEVKDFDLFYLKFVVLNVVRSWFDLDGYDDVVRVIKVLLEECGS